MELRLVGVFHPILGGNWSFGSRLLYSKIGIFQFPLYSWFCNLEDGDNFSISELHTSLETTPHVCIWDDYRQSIFYVLFLQTKMCLFRSVLQTKKATGVQLQTPQTNVNINSSTCKLIVVLIHILILIRRKIWKYVKLTHGRPIDMWMKDPNNDFIQERRRDWDPRRLKPALDCFFFWDLHWIFRKKNYLPLFRELVISLELPNFLTRVLSRALHFAC